MGVIFRVTHHIWFLELTLQGDFCLPQLTDFDSSNIYIKKNLAFNSSREHLISSSKWVIHSFTFLFTFTLSLQAPYSHPVDAQCLVVQDNQYCLEKINNHIYPPLNQYHLCSWNIFQYQICCDSLILKLYSVILCLLSSKIVR